MKAKKDEHTDKPRGYGQTWAQRRDGAPLKRVFSIDVATCKKCSCGCANIVTTKQLAHTSDDLCQHGRMEARVRQWVQSVLSQTPERQVPAFNSGV